MPLFSLELMKPSSLHKRYLSGYTYIHDVTVCFGKEELRRGQKNSNLYMTIVCVFVAL